MSLAFRIANVLGFQGVWFASVFGAGNGAAWMGPAAALVFVAAHLHFSPSRASDLRLLGFAIPLGVVVDSLFAASGTLHYASPWPWDAMAPAWILAMWAGFALTLNHSMAFLRGKTAAAALFGFIGGPLAYWGASQGFDAVDFGVALPVALGAVAVGWAIALPLLYAMDARLSARPAKARANA